jgi:hypothetical protein
MQIGHKLRKEKAMSKHAIAVRGIALATLAAASFSLPMVSAAQAQQPGIVKMEARRAPLYNWVRVPANDSWNRGVARNTPETFDSDSTLPSFSPNYYGSNGG